MLLYVSGFKEFLLPYMVLFHTSAGNCAQSSEVRGESLAYLVDNGPLDPLEVQWLKSCMIQKTVTLHQMTDCKHTA